jgi:ferredoxin
MTLESEIKNYLKKLGVEVIGLAGPGRFDGPPSLDPDYMMKGAKSIVSYALPLDVDAIYDYLSKDSAIPHNIDQIRKNQSSMNVGFKLVKFLEEKGYRAKGIGANIDYRRSFTSYAAHPKFSHRYGAYVSGVAAPGVSGNAITSEYGASAILNTVVTNAVLESDPILDPRHYFDDLCQHCMACKAACPPKMFRYDQEEYALINGQLYPRGKKRDINLCNVSCGGLHALSADKKWSSWGKSWIESWVGVEPDPETQDIGGDALRAFGSTRDLSARLEPIFSFYSKPYEDGLFEDPNRFPDYDDLPGATEGQKLRSYAQILEKILGIRIADPISMSCAHCALVCGPNAEESQKRWKMLSRSGILVYKEGNEPVVARKFEEAAAHRESYQYKISKGVKREYWGLQIKNILKYLGFDFHTLRRKKRYKQKLKKAIAARYHDDCISEKSGGTRFGKGP